MVQTCIERSRPVIEVKYDLPTLPLEMLTEAYLSLRDRRTINIVEGDTFKYEWMLATDALTAWLNENIAEKTAWSVQTIEGQIPVHTDWKHLGTKLNYLIDTGGTDVPTRWHYEGKQVSTYTCLPHVWYSLHVRIPHDVGLILPGRYRISVTHGDQNAFSK